MSFFGYPGRALLTVLGAVGVAMASGCVDNDTSLSIMRYVPPDSTGGTTCMYDTTVMDSLAGGTYDVVAAGIFGQGYNAAFVIQNNLEEDDTQAIEMQAYYVQSYNVRLEVIGPLQTVIPESRRNYNYKNAEIRLTPGQSAVGFAQIIGADQVAAVSSINSSEPGSIVAHIQPVVTRAEEQHVGAESTFPVTFCAGCLLGLTAGQTTLQTCPLPLTMASSGNACDAAADIPINCCETTGGDVLCGQNALNTGSN